MRLSSVQSFLARRIAASLSEKAGVEINIGFVDISDFVKLELRQLSVKDKHDSTFIKADKIEIKITPTYLLDNILFVNDIDIDSTSVSLIEYKGEHGLNLMQIVNVFLDDTSSDTLNDMMKIRVENFRIRNSTFVLDMQNMEHFDGMDYVHLFVDSINIDIQNFRIDNDSLIGEINNISAHEGCGFHLDSLVGHFLVSPRQISIPNLFFKANNTKAFANFGMEYSQWSDWLDFVNKVRFNTVIDSSAIQIDDIKYFSPQLAGMNDLIIASCKLKGSIANLNIRNANIAYGRNTLFKGGLALNGLPDIDQTFLRFKVKKAVVTNSDVASFYLPGKQHIPTNTLFNKLGKIVIKGRFTGFYYDFVSKASFNTNLGMIATDISLQPESRGEKIKYSGKLKAERFDLGELLGTDYIGKLNMQGQIDGVGLSEDAKAEYNIDFQSIELTNYNYQKMSVIGEIENRKITSKISLSNGETDVYADGYYSFKDSLNHLFLFTKIHSAEVNRFFLIPDDTLGRLSTDLYVNVFGSGFDDVYGEIIADSFVYNYKSYHYIADSISLALKLDSQKVYSFDFLSPFVSAQINGFYSFNDFKEYFYSITNNLLPSAMGDIAANSHKTINTHTERTYGNNLHLGIQIIDIDNIRKAFFPDIVVGPNSNLYVDYNYKLDSLVLKLNSTDMDFAHFGMHGLHLKLSKLDSIMTYNIISNTFVTPSEISFDSLQINGDINLDTLNIDMLWGGQNKINSGNFKSRIVWNDTNNFYLNILSSKFYVTDTLWALKTDTRIDYHYHYLSVSDFELFHNDNNLLINGVLSDNTHDVLKFSFNQFDVSLIDFYTKRWDTDLDGIINGDMELSSVWNQPGFISDFVISDFRLNNTAFNSLKVNTLYSRSRHAVVFDITSDSEDNKFKYIDIGGFYYPYRSDNQLDLEIRLDKFPLASIQNYLTSFSSQVKGVAKGRLKLKGNINAPIILGALKTDIDDILIDYTNVHYKIHDKLIFTPDYFGFINAHAEDMFGNKLLLTTKISHHYFSDIKLDIDVQSSSAQLLNTNVTDNELFYGNAYGTGFFKLNGDLNKLNMSMDITPVNSSVINIPISSQYEAEKIDFLSFVVKDSSILRKDDSEESSSLNLGLDMIMNVTPSTQIKLVMNATSGDVISAYGKGKLHMVYKDDVFNIYGKYIINSGNYLFTMQNIINKRFVIEPNSELNWNGDLESATIDLKAIYHVEAKLWDLLQQLDSSEAAVYKRLSKVDCIINITGKLSNPDISFDINLPEETVATKELVRQIISPEATGNSEELNKNFVSLLVLGRFQPPSGYESGSNPNALSHNAYEMLAEQLGNILNNMVDQLEIGVDWNPGDDITTQEVAVALTYKMLNDRLVIDGKFGAGGGSHEADASTRIVGDVNIEYKLTPDGRIRAKVFNRTNYYDPLTRRAPYTQGVGISFRKDFNSFSELFSSKKKNKEPNNIPAKSNNEADLRKNAE